MDLQKTFGHFAGMTVRVKEEQKKLTSDRRTYTFTKCTLDHNDPTIKDIFKTAGSKGITDIRVWLPGMMGTMDFSRDRLNVHIAKGTDNLYKVTQFNMG